MEPKEKHLEFLQDVITRHNSNSFMIKGWAITICTAVYALAGTLNHAFISLVAIVPISIFWVLDSFYLANERCYVSLYNAVVNGYVLKVHNKVLKRKYRVVTQQKDGSIVTKPESEVEIRTSTYSMDYTPFKKIARNNWYNVLISRTILWFYLMLMGFALCIFAGLKYLNVSVTKQPIKVSATLITDSIFVKIDNPKSKAITHTNGDSIQINMLLQKGDK